MKNRIKKSFHAINRPSSLRYGFALAILLAAAFGVVAALEERTALTFSAGPPAGGDNTSGQPSPTVAVSRQEISPANAARITARDISVMQGLETDANGAIVHGSIMTVGLCLENVGTADAGSLVATLKSTPKITPLDTPQAYGLLKADRSSRCRPFSFTFSPGLAVNSPVTLVFEVRDGTASLGEISYTFAPGSPNAVQACSENFDTVTPPNLPPGWSTVTIGAGATPWQTGTIFSDTPPNSAFVETVSNNADLRLDSPAFPITSSTAQMTFANLFSLQTSVEGAVLEISIGGGPFQDILAAGGSFSAGGYNGTISMLAGNPLGGRQAWTGNSGGYIQTVVNLPSSASGLNVIFRWRVGTGNGPGSPSSANNPTGFSGQDIDTISIPDCAGCTLECPPDQFASNTTNQCGATVNYPAPTATGPCGAVTCVPTSGSFFPVGGTTVTCTVAGGTPSCSFEVFVDDTQPPTITCPANITTSNTPGQCSAVVNYADPVVTDNCPGAGIVECSPPVINSPAGGSCSPPAGSAFPVGTTTVRCCAQDAAEISNLCTFTITVNDTQAPVLTCPPNITQMAPSGLCSATVTYSLPTVNENCAPTPTPTCNPASGSIFPVGTTTVNCSATDAATNTGSCSFTVTVTSDQAFSITCPSNITTAAGPGQCSAAVSYPPPSVINACGGSGSATCNPPSGSFFPSGTTTVTCTATSGNNNVMCSFTITVNDNQPPSISCPGNIVRNTDANQCSVAVEFPTPTASDICSSVTVTCSPSSGSRFPTGTQTVTCTATDASRNTASCSFNVTVRDTQAPVVTCPPNVSVTAASNQCSASVNLGTATATDACEGPVTVVGGRSDSQPLTAPFPIGQTTVTYIATDSSGNIGRCVQTVTVAPNGSGVITVDIMPSTITLKTVKVVGVKKAKKRRARGTFMLTNTGCAPLVFAFQPFRRVTDQDRFRETDDSEFFSVFSADANGNPIGENLISRSVTLGQGQANKRTFVVEFNATIPALAGETSNLDTVEVLPDSFISVLTLFPSNQTVTINARVEPRVKLINPANPQGDNGGVTLCRSGNEFIVTYNVYDSRTSDVRSARYEFLDSSDRVVRTVDGVDLAGPIAQRNLVNGQSFSVEQRFSGANDNDEVVRVRVTVSGSNSSATAVSGRVNQNCNGSLLRQFKEWRFNVTLFPPDLKLDGTEP
ncbi:MAG TPA: HYR domain-containing protein [Blastocatellia bacterium]|nr:HYR domain-containing protein [Blastocatellia bacterium]